MDNNYTLTLPTSVGNAGQYLQTDNSGVLSWSGLTTSQTTIESELAEHKERYSATMEALSGFAYEWDAIKDEILFSEDVQNLNLPKKLISSKYFNSRRWLEKKI